MNCCSCGGARILRQAAAGGWDAAQIRPAQSCCGLARQQQQHAPICHQPSDDRFNQSFHHPVCVQGCGIPLQQREPCHSPESVRQGLSSRGEASSSFLDLVQRLMWSHCGNVSKVYLQQAAGCKLPVAGSARCPNTRLVVARRHLTNLHPDASVN